MDYRKTPEQEVAYWRGRVSGLNQVVNFLCVHVLKTRSPEDRMDFYRILEMLMAMREDPSAIDQGARESIDSCRGMLMVLLAQDDQKREESEE